MSNSKDKYLPTPKRTIRNMEVAKFPATDIAPSRVVRQLLQEVTVRTLDGEFVTERQWELDRPDCGCPIDSVRQLHQDMLTGALVCQKCISQCQKVGCKKRVSIYNIEEHEDMLVCKDCFDKLTTRRIRRFFRDL